MMDEHVDDDEQQHQSQFIHSDNSAMIIEPFSKLVHEFISASSNFNKQSSHRASQEQVLQQLHKQIWKTVEQLKQGTASDDGVQPPRLLPFSYKYTTMDFNESHYNSYVAKSQNVHEHVGTVYMGSYFRQLTSQQQLVYEICSHQSEYTSNELYQLLKVLVSIIHQERNAIQKYASTVLQELAVYVGKLYLERESDLSQSYKKCEKILRLIFDHCAFDYLTCLFQPDVSDIVHCKLLDYIFRSEIHFNTTTADQFTKVLTQIPFHLISTVFESDVIKPHLFEPFQRAMAGLKGDEKQNLTLLVKIAKTVLVIVDQYPMLTNEGLLVITRGKWPAKMVSHVVLSMFPWDKISEDMRHAALPELYNIYKKPFETMTDHEHQTHLADYLNKFLVPYNSLVQQIYSSDDAISSMNNDQTYPIIGTLRRVAQQSFNQNKSITQLGKSIVSILFAMAFKSGTTISTHLTGISQVRTEAIHQISTLCKVAPLSFGVLLDEVIQSLSFIVQTQPHAVSNIMDIVVRGVGPQLQVNEVLLDQLSNMMYGNVPNAHIVAGTADASTKIGRVSLTRISWKDQSQETKFKTLEMVLSYVTSDHSAYGWATDLLTSPSGSALTTVTDILSAEDFILRNSQQQSGPLSVAICLLISLSICMQKIQRQSEYASQLTLWRQHVQEMNIVEKLHQSANSSFFGAVLNKYIGCLSYFFATDISQYVAPAAKALSIHLQQQPTTRVTSVDELIKASSSSLKETEMWALILVEEIFAGTNVSVVFEHMVKSQVVSKLSIQPILDALRNKINLNQNLGTVVIDLVSSNRFWSAYAFVLSLEIQLPPVTDKAPVSSDDAENPFYQSTNVELSTDVECGMWLSIECAQKAAQKNYHAISLLYWQHFFTLYFDLIQRYGTGIFPPYLKDRYTIVLSNQLRAFPPDSTFAKVFELYTTWDREQTKEGKLIDDELMALIATNVQPVQQQQQQPLSQYPTQRSNYGPVNSVPVPSSSSQYGIQPQSQYRSQPPLPQPSSINNRAMQPIPQMSMTMQRLDATTTTATQPPQPSQSNYPFRPQTPAVFQPSQYRSQTPGPSMMHQSQVIVPPQTQQVQQQPPPSVRSTVATTPLETVVPKMRPKIEKPLDLVVPSLKIPVNPLGRDRERYTKITQEMGETFAKHSQQLLVLTDDFNDQLQEQQEQETSVEEQGEVEICIQINQYFTEYLTSVENWFTLNEQYEIMTKSIYVNNPSSTALSLTGVNGNHIQATCPTTVIELSDPDILVRMNENRAKVYQIQKRLHEIVDSLAIIYIVLQRCSVVLTSDPNMKNIGVAIVLQLLPLLLDMNLSQKLADIWLHFAREVGGIGANTVSKVSNVQAKVLKVLLNAPALPPPKVIEQPQLVTVSKPGIVDQIISGVSQLLSPFMNQSSRTAQQPTQNRGPPSQYAPLQQQSPAYRSQTPLPQLQQQQQQYRPTTPGPQTPSMYPPQPSVSQHQGYRPITPAPPQSFRPTTPLPPQSQRQMQWMGVQQQGTSGSVLPPPPTTTTTTTSITTTQPSTPMSERIVLFSAFNPNILLQENNQLAYIDLLKLISETSTKISPTELRYLCSRFDLQVLFREFAQYPSGQRFTARDEMKVLLTALRLSLTRVDLQKSLGNTLLRNCCQLAFPLETHSFIKLVLTLSASKEYLADDWHDLILVGDLTSVSAELAMNWLNTIALYQPLPEPAASCSLRLAQMIISRTALASFLERSELYSDTMNSVIQFFASFVSSEDKDKTISEGTFAFLLDILASISRSTPVVVDRLWQFYRSVLYPFVLTLSPQYQAILTQFMRKIDWRNAVFHVQAIETLDELVECLLDDTGTVAAVFHQLSWAFVKRKGEQSIVICKVVKIYIALELLGFGGYVPADLRQFIEGLDQYEYPDPIWTRLDAEDFANVFSGGLLLKLLTSGKAMIDPTPALSKLAYWMSEIALSMKNEMVANVCAREVRYVMFLILKGTSSTIWFIDGKTQANLLMHTIIPLTVKYASPVLIQYFLSSLYEIESGVDPVIVKYSIPYSIGFRCPFEKGVIAQYGSGDAHKQLIEKFRNVIIHFADSSNESLALNLLGCVLMIELHLETEVIVLEHTIRSYLRQTNTPSPRTVAANSIRLPQHMVLYSSSFNSLLDSCVDNHCALALSVLVNKLLSITIQMDTYQSPDSIVNGYIYAMDSVLKFVPHPNREDFDIVYLYFMALEMIDSPYWDLRNPYVQERTQRFTEIIQYLGAKYHKEWSHKFKKFNVSDKMKESKITPGTCLAIRAIRVYLHEILANKQLLNNSMQGSLLLNSNSSRGNNYTNEHYEYMMKLRSKREFEAYSLFFHNAPILLQQQLDHDQFRETVASIFPLVQYMGKV